MTVHLTFKEAYEQGRTSERRRSKFTRVTELVRQMNNYTNSFVARLFGIDEETFYISNPLPIESIRTFQSPSISKVAFELTSTEGFTIGTNNPHVFAKVSARALTDTEKRTLYKMLLRRRAARRAYEATLDQQPQLNVNNDDMSDIPF